MNHSQPSTDMSLAFSWGKCGKPQKECVSPVRFKVNISQISLECQNYTDLLCVLI